MGTGVIVRKMDCLGRIVIPKKIREELKIDSHDKLEITVDNDKLYLTKVEPSCVFCDSLTNIKPYQNMVVCDDCVSEMKVNIQ